MPILDSEAYESVSRALAVEVAAILNRVLGPTGRMAVIWDREDLPMYIPAAPDQPTM